MPSSGFSAANRLRIEASTGMWRSAHSIRPDRRREGQVGDVVVLGGSRHSASPGSLTWRQRKALQGGVARGGPSAPATAKYRGAVGAVPAAQATSSRELGLQPVDRLDRGRIDAAQHREVDRHEVAEQHERQHALDRVGRPRLSMRSVPAAWASISGRGQLDPLAHARVLVGVLEEHRR